MTLNDVSLHKIKDIGVIIGFIFIYVVFYQYVSTGSINNVLIQPDDVDKLMQDTLQDIATEIPNDILQDIPQDTTSLPLNNTSDVTPYPNTETSVIDSNIDPIPVPDITPENIEPRTHRIRMDINGFYPDVITINVSDSISWTNFENQRMRVVLISKDDLFEKQVMLDGNRFEYQFMQKGNYSFVLADPPSDNEYPKAKGKVIVN